MWSQPQPATAPGAFGQLCQGCPGWEFWGVCAGPGLGLHNSCVFLPAQEILGFYVLTKFKVAYWFFFSF